MKFTKKYYNITLTKNQKHSIYKITDNKDKQNRLMSIYQYCIKYTDKATGMLSKTIGKLFSMYSTKDFKYHDKISRKYFYTLINILIDKKLIFVDKVHKTVHKVVHKTEVLETIEIANVEADFEKPNNQTTNYNTYTYTPNTTNVVKALDLANEVFKDLKIKSKIIKSMVIAKLQNTVLNVVGAVNYIIKVITEKTEQYNSMRVEYAKVVAKTKYSKSKNTFVAPAKTSRAFNNFNPRKTYDNEQTIKDLENKLTPKKSKSNITELLNNYKSK